MLPADARLLLCFFPKPIALDVLGFFVESDYAV
jgi:hypothetical protein